LNCIAIIDIPHWMIIAMPIPRINFLNLGSLIFIVYNNYLFNLIHHTIYIIYYYYNSKYLLVHLFGSTVYIF